MVYNLTLTAHMSYASELFSYISIFFSFVWQDKSIYYYFMCNISINWPIYACEELMINYTIKARIYIFISSSFLRCHFISCFVHFNISVKACTVLLFFFFSMLSVSISSSLEIVIKRLYIECINAPLFNDIANLQMSFVQ